VACNQGYAGRRRASSATKGTICREYSRKPAESAASGGTLYGETGAKWNGDCQGADDYSSPTSASTVAATGLRSAGSYFRALNCESCGYAGAIGLSPGFRILPDHTSSGDDYFFVD
jgi:hypothetical protein